MDVIIVGKPLKETGAKIRRIREHLNMTRKEFAPYLGISDQHLYKIETGQRNPTLAMIYRLIEAFPDTRSEFKDELLENRIEEEPDVAHMVDPLLKEAMKEIPRMTPAMRRNLEALFALWRELDKPDKPEGGG